MQIESKTKVENCCNNEIKIARCTLQKVYFHLECCIDLTLKQRSISALQPNQSRWIKKHAPGHLEVSCWPRAGSLHL